MTAALPPKKRIKNARVPMAPPMETATNSAKENTTATSEETAKMMKAVFRVCACS